MVVVVVVVVVVVKGKTGSYVLSTTEQNEKTRFQRSGRICITCTSHNGCDSGKIPYFVGMALRLHHTCGGYMVRGRPFDLGCV
jgi:hypothetical protein